MKHNAKTESLVRAICSEYEIQIVPANVFPMPGQTRAVSTMCQILAKYGEGHFRLVMTTLGETRGNNALIDQLRGVINQRLALAGAIYWRLCTYSEQRMSAKDTTSTIKNKVPEVGRARRNANREQVIETGRKLIDIRSRLPHGEWLPWVQEQSGLSYGTVQRYTRMAMEERSAS
ncbi:DUF3102 domain-containing protein [Rhizobium sp. A22-96]